MVLLNVAAQTTESAIAVPVVDNAEISMGLAELFLKGGWLMIPLVLLLGYAIYIFVERYLVIKRASKVDAQFMNQIKDLMYEGKIGLALQVCRGTNNSVARMIEKGIEHLGRPVNEIHSSIENVANLEVSKLERGLPIMATISGGAPMIGFLGTVIGMVEAFMNLAQADGAVDLQLLSNGMYTAMVTTVAGLSVGIPAFFGYNILVQKIEKTVFQMQANSIAFMDILNHPVREDNN